MPESGPGGRPEIAPAVPALPPSLAVVVRREGKRVHFFAILRRMSCYYVTKNSRGANFRVSPEGVKRMDALNKNGGIRGRFPIAARLHGCRRYSSAGAVAE